MGCGRVGATLTRSLERRGHTTAVIDSNPDAFRRLGPSFSGITVTGMGFDKGVLEEAGIEKADGFAAVSSGDNSNIISARVAREQFGVTNIVARIYDPGRAEVYERLGVPTVATVTWAADQVLRRLLPAGSEPAWRDPSGELRLESMDAPSAWIGHEISSLEDQVGRARRLPHASRCRTHRPRRHRHPGGRPPEHLHARGRGRGCPRAPGRRAGGRLMRVAIAGAGAVGRSVALELVDNGHQVLLIDKTPAAIRSDLVPDAQWLLADACELSSLEEAQLETCDVVIASTGDDKANLVISLLAKTEFSVPRTVGRVNHPDNEWLFGESWGVDVSVSTPRLMSALVEEAVSVGDLVRLFTFRQSDTNLVELTMPGDSPFVGNRVSDVPWPDDVVLVAILRDNTIQTPDRDRSLESGDELLFVTPEDSEDQLSQLLSPKKAS